MKYQVANKALHLTTVPLRTMAAVSLVVSCQQKINIRSLTYGAITIKV